MNGEFDFSGYATRNDLLCADGRVIRKNAFKDNDGATVPLVWNHDHTNPEAVLGHALLENRDDGVYAYCKFNDTEAGQNAKKLIMHGDVRSLSIYANKLKQIGRDVVHGAIRELSLVLAGANPGATVDFVMAHGDNDDAGFYANYDESALMLYHSEEKKGDEEVDIKTNKPEDVLNELTDAQRAAVNAMIDKAREEASAGEIKHSDDPAEKASKKSEDEETVEDVFNTLTEKQKTVVFAIIAQIMDDAKNNDPKGGNDDMKHNVFDQEETMDNVLTHSEMDAIFEDAKRCGSLKDAVLAHGITDIDVLFPDAQTLEKEPGFIKRNDDWVEKVINGVHHSPFASVKSIFADITADEARAKGYIKGKQKLEEVIKLLKRETTPTTVYKKQKINRDDLLDISDFNVIPWLKSELRMMLNEELARAYLIGDGRSAVSEDKINEDNIRPIWKMEDLFTVKVPITVKTGATADDRAREFIKACVKSRKLYKGSGNPSMFMPEDILTDCMLIEDANGRVIYETEEKLRARLRVKEIIPVPVMENQTREDNDSKTCTLAGIYVNLADYNVGTNKGGEITMFDDFDLDYNAYKYLMETRCSGTLTKPYSAVALEFVEASS